MVPLCVWYYQKPDMTLSLEMEIGRKMHTQSLLDKRATRNYFSNEFQKASDAISFPTLTHVESVKIISHK